MGKDYIFVIEPTKVFPNLHYKGSAYIGWPLKSVVEPEP
jgi:hypothetical protein